MSGEEASSSGAGSGSGGARIPYDYSSTINKHERSANHNKPPMFNGDPEMVSWWKSKMYSHIIGMGEELWVKVRKTQEGGGGGLYCVLKDFFVSNVEELFSGSESEVIQSLSEFRVVCSG